LRREKGTTVFEKLKKKEKARRFKTPRLFPPYS